MSRAYLSVRVTRERRYLPDVCAVTDFFLKLPKLLKLPIARLSLPQNFRLCRVSSQHNLRVSAYISPTCVQSQAICPTGQTSPTCPILSPTLTASRLSAVPCITGFNHVFQVSILFSTSFIPARLIASVNPSILFLRVNSTSAISLIMTISL